MLRGACRYTDVRNGLPGIATNLLAERLRGLEQSGVIAREDAPPPIATTLFRLTPRGEQLRPVLEGLMRWGIPLMTVQSPDDAVRSHWIAGALELMLTDSRPGAPPVTVELDIGDQPIVLETRDGAIHTRLGPADSADVVITGEARRIMGLLLGLTELADAQTAGVSYQGDPAILDRISGGMTADTM